MFQFALPIDALPPPRGSGDGARRDPLAADAARWRETLDGALGTSRRSPRGDAESHASAGQAVAPGGEAPGAERRAESAAPGGDAARTPAERGPLANAGEADPTPGRPAGPPAPTFRQLLRAFSGNAPGDPAVPEPAAPGVPADASGVATRPAAPGALDTARETAHARGEAGSTPVEPPAARAADALPTDARDGASAGRPGGPTLFAGRAAEDASTAQTYRETPGRPDGPALLTGRAAEDTLVTRTHGEAAGRPNGPAPFTDRAAEPARTTRTNGEAARRPGGEPGAPADGTDPSAGRPRSGEAVQPGQDTARPAPRAFATGLRGGRAIAPEVPATDGRAAAGGPTPETVSRGTRRGSRTGGFVDATRASAAEPRASAPPGFRPAVPLQPLPLRANHLRPEDGEQETDPRRSASRESGAGRQRPDAPPEPGAIRLVALPHAPRVAAVASARPSPPFVRETGATLPPEDARGSASGADRPAAAGGDDAAARPGAQVSTSVEGRGTSGNDRAGLAARAAERPALRSEPVPPGNGLDSPAGPAVGGTASPPGGAPAIHAPRVALHSLAETIVARARALPQPGSLDLRFALDPPDLGLVRVRIESRGDEIRIRIVTSSGAAADALGSGIARMAAHLGEHGARAPHIDLVVDDPLGGGNGSRDARGEAESGSRRRAAARPAAARTSPLAELRLAGRDADCRLDRMA